jgi:HAD superfamily hydrolase (TIGR01509 family)
LDIQAVIFDLDGVLVNTEPLAFKAWQQILAHTGKIMGEEDYLAMIGMDSTASTRYVNQFTGMNWTEAEIMPRLWARMEKIVDEELEPLPGSAELVAELGRRGLHLAVASNSDTRYVRHVLEKVRLLPAFEAVIGRDQVSQGKPAPDPYLKAAAHLGCDPQHCLAIEDSTIGLQAAVSAGMRCLGITPTGECSNGHASAYACFRSMEELNQSIGALLD